MKVILAALLGYALAALEPGLAVDSAPFQKRLERQATTSDDTGMIFLSLVRADDSVDDVVFGLCRVFTDPSIDRDRRHWLATILHRTLVTTANWERLPVFDALGLREDAFDARVDSALRVLATKSQSDLCLETLLARWIVMERATFRPSLRQFARDHDLPMVREARMEYGLRYVAARIQARTSAERAQKETLYATDQAERDAMLRRLSALGVPANVIEIRLRERGNSIEPRRPAEPSSADAPEGR